MEWINGETKESKIYRRENWHSWFAWFPVDVGDIIVEGKRRTIKVWLEYVMRKGEYTCLGWRYKYSKVKKLGVMND